MRARLGTEQNERFSQQASERKLAMQQPTNLEQYMLELVNYQRALVGSQPVAWDEGMGQAADNHNQWILTNDTFDHSEGGKTLSQQLDEAGFQWRAGSYSIWQNHQWQWGWGLPDAEYVAFHNQNYVNSETHYANMIDPTHKIAGMGWAVG